MAAGQGFKTFATGDVLSAADVNGYLMQGVLVFADSAERDAEITSPEEGQFAYLKDTNVTTYYTGSAWANLDTTGMTNPMTTTGDVIYSSSGSTPARLGIGTAGQVLQVNSGATAPEWATAGASATSYSLINIGGTTLSGASTVTISSLSGYNKFHILVKDAVSSSYSNYTMRFNADTSSIYSTYGGVGYGTSSYSSNVFRNQSETNATSAFWGKPSGDNTSVVGASIQIDGANSSGIKVLQINSGGSAPSNDGNQMINSGGTYTGSSVISSISFICGGTWSSGTIYIYGAN
jgi:hypothetical protein